MLTGTQLGAGPRRCDGNRSPGSGRSSSTRPGKSRPPTGIVPAGARSTGIPPEPHLQRGQASRRMMASLHRHRRRSRQEERLASNSRTRLVGKERGHGALGQGFDLRCELSLPTMLKSHSAVDPIAIAAVGDLPTLTDTLQHGDDNFVVEVSEGGGGRDTRRRARLNSPRSNRSIQLRRLLRSCPMSYPLAGPPEPSPRGGPAGDLRFVGRFDLGAPQYSSPFPRPTPLRAVDRLELSSDRPLLATRVNDESARCDGRPQPPTRSGMKDRWPNGAERGRARATTSDETSFAEPDAADRSLTQSRPRWRGRPLGPRRRGRCRGGR
jgi:hypothetical protein